MSLSCQRDQGTQNFHVSIFSTQIVSCLCSCWCIFLSHRVRTYINMKHNMITQIDIHNRNTVITPLLMYTSLIMQGTKADAVRDGCYTRFCNRARRCCSNTDCLPTRKLRFVPLPPIFQVKINPLRQFPFRSFVNTQRRNASSEKQDSQMARPTPMLVPQL